MAAADFPRNLKLLCSYGRSVSAVCRAARINRHQMKRYLAGSTSPSLHTLRRICDFFGLEEHEILLGHEAFAALIRVRPPKLQKTRDRIAEFIGAVADTADLGVARHYTGYYHVYFQPDRQVPEIHRALTHVTLADRCLLTKTIERYPSGSAGLPKSVKYDGVAFVNGRALTVMERRRGAADVGFYTLLYGAGAGELTFLTGLTMGVAPDSSRLLYGVRMCWHYLGEEIDIRRRLGQCGQFPLDHPSIGKYVRFCTTNDLAEGEAAFAPRS
ncbi:MAG: helix-turn-helix transcriptional regulator [Rhizobiales bacterium]|nr:helix-turn-helix transcriptional regulator [Hyphomicrobiales bacterium]MBI3672438.1 helix-turn-helix transcriptional regulator [Hyphomicrobiales bacterium]